MANEIELKLAVTSDFAGNLAQSLTDFHILARQQSFLKNTYYDTAERDFAKRKMGLRVRLQNNQFELTLKTDGKVTSGLHIRPEYNFPLPSEIPNLSLLSAELPELQLPNQVVLEPIFTTDFERQSWLVECGKDTEIEVALDRGEIRASHNITPICEVEFELKRGELRDLFALVENLTLTDGVRLSSVSKAQRGYQLSSAQLPLLTDWIEKWRAFLETEQKAQHPCEILTALIHYEQQLIEETQRFTIPYFAHDFMRTVERVGAFFNVANYYIENRKWLNLAAAEAKLDETMATELIENQEWLFSQLRQLILLHSETRDNTLVMNKLNDLLHQGLYVKRMINLLRVMVV